jgi:hypothetical protein
MPDSKPTAEVVASAKVTPPAEDAVTVTLDRLLVDSIEFLGHPSYVVAGAFHGVAPSKEIDLKTAKKRIDEWLKAPVATDQAEEE